MKRMPTSVSSPLRGRGFRDHLRLPFLFLGGFPGLAEPQSSCFEFLLFIDERLLPKRMEKSQYESLFLRYSGVPRRNGGQK